MTEGSGQIDVRTDTPFRIAAGIRELEARCEELERERGLLDTLTMERGQRSQQRDKWARAWKRAARKWWNCNYAANDWTIKKRVLNEELTHLRVVRDAAKPLFVHYHVEKRPITLALDEHHSPAYDETVTIKKHLWDALRDALERE